MGMGLAVAGAGALLGCAGKLTLAHSVGGPTGPHSHIRFPRIPHMGMVQDTGHYMAPGLISRGSYLSFQDRVAAGARALPPTGPATVPEPGILWILPLVCSQAGLQVLPTQVGLGINLH